MKNLASNLARLGVGAVAKTLGVTPQAVRDLEKSGVVRAVRDSAGRRLFTEAQVAALVAYRAARVRK
jgi:DNA-binding transcriptional MerR regulator